MEYLKDVLALCGNQKTGGVSEGSITLNPFQTVLVKYLAKEQKYKLSEGKDGQPGNMTVLGGGAIEIKCSALVDLCNGAGRDFQFPEDMLPREEEVVG